MPELLVDVAAVWLAVLFAATIVVLVRAASPFMRILAADTMVLLVVAFLLLLAMKEERGVLVDAAIALALLGFTTTVVLARIEREAQER
jgi:multisubunit Na+/H+ antiporter MnhF subunit